MQFFLEDAKNQTEQVSGLLVSKWLIDFLAGCTSQDGGSKSSHDTWAPYNLSWPLPGQRGRVCVHSSQIGEACDHGKGDTLWLLKAMPYKWIKFLSSSLDTLALGTLPQCCDEGRQHQREATCMCSGWQPSWGPTCQLTSVIGLCVNKPSDDSGPHEPSPDLSHPSSWFVELSLQTPAQIAGLWADKGASQMALPAYQCRRPKRCGFEPWVRKIPWRRAWQSTPVFLPGESHEQRNPEGYSPQGQKELDTTEVT